MFRNFSIAAAAAISFISVVPSALADGENGSLKDAPPPPETYNWTGPYIAAGIGVGRIDSEISVTPPAYSCYGDMICAADAIILPPPSKSYSNDDWDVFGTLQIGYDRLHDDRLLFGVFTDIDFYGDASHSFTGSVSNPYTTIKGNFDLDHIWSIGGRVGVLIHPDFLVYATGGYSRADVDASVTTYYYDWPTKLKFSDHLDGWFIGGGFERKLRRDVSLKFEYRYMDFEDASFEGEPLSMITKGAYYPPPSKADLDVDVHSIRAAIVLKLDEPEPPPAPLK